MNVVTERPQAPSGYGYSTGPKGMLSWESVRDALAAANALLDRHQPPRRSASPSSDLGWMGRPSCSTSRVVRPPAGRGTWRGIPASASGSNRMVSTSTGAAIVERGPAGDDFKALVANYGGKYDYKPQTDVFYKVTPEVVIALNMSSMEDFASSPTRFRFET